MENEQQRLAENHGLHVETVGDIIEQREGAPLARPAPFDLPRLEGYTPPFPEPGIYFDMPEDVYHAVPALSTGGIKQMASSPMLFWAQCKWMNPDYQEREEKEHFDVGHAYHCRILEGRDQFWERFALYLDKSSIEGLLESTDQIKTAIEKAGEKPVTRVPTGEEIPDPKTGEMKPVLRAAKKEDWIAQLLELEPDAQIWSVLEEQYAAEHAGKTMIGHNTFKQLEFAAAMIERDPELGPALRGGWPEVSLFWICAKTGVPMKARVDYLKLKMMVDLKTVQNSHDKSIERVIASDIASRRYVIQPAVYFEGAEAVKRLVRERQAAAVFVWIGGQATTLLPGNSEVQWALKWAAQQQPAEWLWIYQQKGVAPVARGVLFQRQGSHRYAADNIVETQKRRFRQFAETAGTDAWLDVRPIYELDDSELPNYATEI